MLTVGENVIYGSIGVCKITEITSNKLSGIMREYYVLRPVETDKSVIYVPVDNEKLVSRIRAIPSSKELKKILDDVKGEKLDWIENSLERSESYHAILNDGDIKEIIKVVRALHLRALKLSRFGKHLPKTDERIYKDASKLLCTEFASILNINSKEILSLILDTTD